MATGSWRLAARHSERHDASPFWAKPAQNPFCRRCRRQPTAQLSTRRRWRGIGREHGTDYARLVPDLFKHMNRRHALGRLQCGCALLLAARSDCEGAHGVVSVSVLFPVSSWPSCASGLCLSVCVHISVYCLQPGRACHPRCRWLFAWMCMSACSPQGS